MSWAAKDKEHAKELGKAMRAKMDFPGRWKVRVWENMGWHYCLHCGNVAVYPCGFREDKRPTYHALVASEIPAKGEYPGGGLSAWSTHGATYKKPQTAVDEAVAAAVSYVEYLQLAVQEAKRAL